MLAKRLCSSVVSQSLRSLPLLLLRVESLCLILRTNVEGSVMSLAWNLSF